MGGPLPKLQPERIIKAKEYRDVLYSEMDAGKIPISLGKNRPVAKLRGGSRMKD